MLVCKDAKAAALLDVVEGMQDRYIKAAKETSAAYIVGALNILNEAEVNYKMAFPIRCTYIYTNRKNYFVSRWKIICIVSWFSALSFRRLSACALFISAKFS